MIFGLLFKKARTAPKAPVRKAKRSKRKITKSSRAKKTQKIKIKEPKEELIGRITHFYPKVSAGVIKLKKTLIMHDTIHVRGHTSDFIQKVSSLQIDNKPIKRASGGKLVGFLAARRVRRHDKVYKVKQT